MTYQQNLGLLAGFFSAVLFGQTDMTPVVEAQVSTEAMLSADDPAIYINVQDPLNSLIIATDKKTGLFVYDLSGKEVQILQDGKQNNVDLKHNVIFGEDKLPLIVAGNRTTKTADFYYIDESHNRVEPLSVRSIPLGMDPYGICLYQNRIKKTIYLIATQKDGLVVQWLIETQKDRMINLIKVREIKLQDAAEGCVADDEYNYLYIAEEDLGIWKYRAEPFQNESPQLVDITRSEGPLVSDVEGLAIYATPEGKGYLIASSQGNDSYVIYDRITGAYVNHFQISYQESPTQNTDGLAVTSMALGDTYPKGLLVVHFEDIPKNKQGYRLVSWEKIAAIEDPPLETATQDPFVLP